MDVKNRGIRRKKKIPTHKAPVIVRFKFWAHLQMSLHLKCFQKVRQNTLLLLLVNTSELKKRKQDHPSHDMAKQAPLAVFSSPNSIHICIYSHLPSRFKLQRHIHTSTQTLLFHYNTRAHKLFYFIITHKRTILIYSVTVLGRYEQNMFSMRKKYQIHDVAKSAIMLILHW